MNNIKYINKYGNIVNKTISKGFFGKSITKISLLRNNSKEEKATLTKQIDNLDYNRDIFLGVKGLTNEVFKNDTIPKNTNLGLYKNKTNLLVFLKNRYFSSRKIEITL